MRIKKDLKEYIQENMHDIAESHIECWKDRYFRKSKQEIRIDLDYNHDDSIEIENVEEALGRKLTDSELFYFTNKFHSAVVKQIY